MHTPVCQSHHAGIPVQHNDMDMRVEIQARAETLHERDSAAMAPHTRLNFLQTHSRHIVDRSARPERGRVAACEFGGGNRGTTDQLLERVGHAVVAVVAMQLAHGDQVCDQMRR